MSERAVHDAVYSRLNSQLSVPVYDHAPQGAAFPYVTLSAHDVIAQDSQGINAGLHDITLTVWSDHRGQQEVLDLMGEIYDALHHFEASLSSGVAVLMQIAERRATQDADGVTYMGTVTVEIIAQR